MKKLLILLTAVFLIIAVRSAAAEEQYIIGLLITPYTTRENGLQEDISYEVKVVSGESVPIDLRAFQTVMTIEKHGEDMTFTFDHDLEMLSGSAVIQTRRIILEKNADAHLRTPVMENGAWLAVSWGSDEIPFIYQNFIRSIRSIYEGKPNARYGAYEDFSIMFAVQSVFPKEEKTLGYAVKDIDGDGTVELLFGDMYPDESGTILYDLYTIEQGELVHVFDGWDRNRYYLTADGGFIRRGSNGAANSFTSFYVYEHGKLHLLRSVICNTEINKDSPWFLSYSSENDLTASLPISDYDALKIFSYYTGMQLELTPFEN